MTDEEWLADLERAYRGEKASGVQFDSERPPPRWYDYVRKLGPVVALWILFSLMTK